MADYSGYFLQGLASGIQTGMDMGTQLQEMKWQKKQRKELEEKQAKMLEVSNLWNAKIKEAGADNIYSDEEIAQITTIYLSGGYEFMEHYKGAMDAIKSMNKAKYDQEKEWMDLFISGAEGLPPGDIQAMYEYVQPYVTSEKGKNTLEAYNNILQKRGKIAEAQPTAEVFPSFETARAKYPEAKTGFNAQAGGYVVEAGEVKPQVPGITDYNSAANYLSKFMNASPETFNKIKAGLQKNTGLDLSAITQQSLRKPAEVTPESTPAPLSTEKIRADILEADTFKDAERIYKNYADKYDETALGITDLKQEWVNGKKTDLDNLVSVLSEITAGTPEGRNVKGNKEFTFEINGTVTTKTGKEWYKAIYESYNALLKLLEEQGVDTSQYKKLKPLSEIKKIKFGGFVGSGVETGDLIKIYY